jgi:phage terminase large subunit
VFVPFPFDFKNPDYAMVARWRFDTLKNIRQQPEKLEGVKAYYRQNPGDFITHWGNTYDPRNADIGLPTTIPFVLFEKQYEFVDYIMSKWRSRERGLAEKSREVGLSWLTIALAATLCLFIDGVSIGFGSRLERYVDSIGDPKTLFWKLRTFVSLLPREFRAGWNVKKNAPYMRMLFPDTGSSIVGEAGDNIGRGDRKSIYFVDESAYLERADLVEAALSQTTNCRIDISSVRGMGNVFAQNRFSGRYDVFTFHWRDDPRKDEEWYQKQVNNLDPVILAQEVDINYNASVEGMLIPSEWVQSAVGAAQLLGIEVTGAITAALDIADEGRDLNALCIGKGIELIHLSEWTGKGGDTLSTAQRAAGLCDLNECSLIRYDADGIGSGIRSDFRVINDQRKEQGQKEITIETFRGSSEVGQPESEMVKGRKNKDFFYNRKAQAYWALRLRFQLTHRVVQAFKAKERYDYNPDQLISLPANLPMLSKLMMELSQPTSTLTVTGKVIVDKAPDGARSPNLSDGVMMRYAPPKRGAGLFT